MTSNPARRVRAVLPTLALTLACVAGLAGCGDDAAGTTPDASESSRSPGEITIEDPWVRATTGTEDPSMTAAFLVVDNDTGAELTLESASSPVAGMVQLHEMATVDGATVMREAEGGIPIPADGGKVLQPGGYHVMLMGLTTELAPGDEVELTLGFSDGTTQEVVAPVKEFTEEEGHYHSPGTEEHGH